MNKEKTVLKSMIESAKENGTLAELKDNIDEGEEVIEKIIKEEIKKEVRDKIQPLAEEISDRLEDSPFCLVEIRPGEVRFKEKGGSKDIEDWRPNKEKNEHYFFVVDGDPKGWSSLSPGISKGLGINSYASVSQKTGYKSKEIKEEIARKGMFSCRIQGIKFEIYNEEVQK